MTRWWCKKSWRQTEVGMRSLGRNKSRTEAQTLFCQTMAVNFDRTTSSLPFSFMPNTLVLAIKRRNHDLNCLCTLWKKGKEEERRKNDCLNEWIATIILVLKTQLLSPVTFMAGHKTGRKKRPLKGTPWFTTGCQRSGTKCTISLPLNSKDQQSVTNTTLSFTGHHFSSRLQWVTFLSRTLSPHTAIVSPFSVLNPSPNSLQDLQYSHFSSFPSFLIPSLKQFFSSTHSFRYPSFSTVREENSMFTAVVSTIHCNP